MKRASSGDQSGRKTRWKVQSTDITVRSRANTRRFRVMQRNRVKLKCTVSRPQ